MYGLADIMGKVLGRVGVSVCVYCMYGLADIMGQVFDRVCVYVCVQRLS